MTSLFWKTTVPSPRKNAPPKSAVANRKLLCNRCDVADRECHHVRDLRETRCVVTPRLLLGCLEVCQPLDVALRDDVEPFVRKRSRRTGVMARATLASTEMDSSSMTRTLTRVYAGNHERESEAPAHVLCARQSSALVRQRE